MDINFPPAIPFGEQEKFEQGIFFEGDVNDVTLRAGITEKCWTNVNVPFLPIDEVTDFKNCCLRTAYFRVLELIYDAETALVSNFFHTWLGAGVTVHHYPEDGLIPAMTIVQSATYSMCFVTGTTTFQQLATQAFHGLEGPTNFGGVRSTPIWFDLSLVIQTRLNELAIDEEAPLVLVGHSYGAAGLAAMAIRIRLANPLTPLFFLSCGMPKPTDEIGIQVLHEMTAMHVFNRGDFVVQLPLAFYQSEWFGGIIQGALKKKWGQWSGAKEYLIQSLDGTKEINHLPGMTGDVILPLLTQLFIGGELAPIMPHRIREYVLRSCFGCNCPRWPFEGQEWQLLFSERCGDRGFRFRADIPFVPPFDGSLAKFRFAAVVFDPPPIPYDCYCLCLNAASSQFAQTASVSALDGTSEFTLMYFGKRSAAFDIVTAGQAAGVLASRVEITFFQDGNIYFIIAGVASLDFGFFGPINDTLKHHVAMVFDGSGSINADRLKAYIDGAQVALTFVGTIPAIATTGANPFFVGKRIDDGYFQTGDTCQLALFTTALDGPTIEGIANAEINPMDFLPEMLIRFGEGEGSFAADSSGNGHDFTIVNGGGWCGNVCLPRSAARFKFAGEVVAVIPSIEVIPAKYKWHSVVFDASPIGDRIPGKFKWHGEVITVPNPGEPIEAKFRFSGAIWVRSIAGSTKAIAFTSELAQYQRYEHIGLFSTGAFTLSFWAKVPLAGKKAAISIYNSALAILDVVLADGDGLGLRVKVQAEIDEVLHTWSGTAFAIDSKGWHFYAFIFEEGNFGEPNKYYFYVDGELRSISSSSDPEAWPWTKSYGDTVVGLSSIGEYSDCYFDNVNFFIGTATQEQLLQVANGEIDIASIGSHMLFRYEEDIEWEAWESNNANWFPEFFGNPDHTDDVPPLLGD